MAIQRPTSDQLTAQQMLWRLRQGEDVRRKKLLRIRKLLVANGYENELKLHVAAERLLPEVAPGNIDPV